MYMLHSIPNTRRIGAQEVIDPYEDVSADAEINVSGCGRDSKA